MKRDAANYSLVGLMVLAALGLLLGGLFLITGRSMATVGYVVRYHNVSGLRAGVPVYYEGYRIGEVGGIVPERSASGIRYRVALAVRRDWPIPADSEAQLQSRGVLADVSIGIREGKSAQMLAPGAELAGIERSDVFAAMNDMATAITEISQKQLRPMLDNLARSVEVLSQGIDRNAPELFDTTRQLVERLDRAAVALDELLGPANRALVRGNLEDSGRLLAELRATRGTLQRALEEVAALVHETRPDLRHSAADLAAILDQLRVRVDAISRDIETASRNMNQFMREVRQRPDRLIRSPAPDRLQGEDE